MRYSETTILLLIVENYNTMLLIMKNKCRSVIVANVKNTMNLTHLARVTTLFLDTIFINNIA